MTRKRKIITAGLIVTLGLVLAWPFRRAPGELEKTYSPEEIQGETLRADNGDPIAAEATPATGIPIAPEQVPARVASTNDLDNPSPARLESFDLANHPAIANVLSSPESKEGLLAELPQTVSADSRPVYSTADTAPGDRSTDWPTELIHVVTNGDTLEKLAERYLNDAGRALEIFDLNRDQLTNPHLLPIGVELRVPVDPDRIID